MRLANVTPSMTLFLSGTLLALGACGDDGSTGSGGSSTGGADSTTAGTPNTTMESADSSDGPGVTTDEPTTDDPTTDGPTTTTGETTTGPPPGGAISFRFNSIELTDPGAGFGGPCGNADQVNGLLAGPIANDDDGDGFLDMSFVLDFPALDQEDAASGMLTFANAQCDEPDGPMCGLLPGTEASPAMYTVMADGVCLEADPANIEPGTGNTGTTSGPCFVSENLDATVVTAAVSLPLSDARIAAQFVGNPAGNLVSGTLEGFLSLQDAENTTVDVLGMMIPLDGLLCTEQMDGDGWWMHMNFTAVTTEWTG